MKSSRVFTIVLLLAFLSFAVLLSQTGNQTHRFGTENKTIVVFGEVNAHDIHLKADEKKHTFKLLAGPALTVFHPVAFCLYSTLSFINIRTFVFFIPIFYQSNFVIRTP